MLGLLSASHVAVWVLALLTLGLALINKDILLLQELGVVVGVRWIIQWILFFIINRRLDRTVEWFSFLLMDFAFFIYYVFFGFFVMTRRKPRNTWN